MQQNNMSNCFTVPSYSHRRHHLRLHLPPSSCAWSSSLSSPWASSSSSWRSRCCSRCRTSLACARPHLCPTCHHAHSGPPAQHSEIKSSLFPTALQAIQELSDQFLLSGRPPTPLRKGPHGANGRWIRGPIWNQFYPNISKISFASRPMQTQKIGLKKISRT